jgi:MFS family permease
MTIDWIRDYRTIPPEAMLVITTSFLPSLLLGMVFTDLPYHLTVIQGLPDIFMGAMIMVMGIAVILSSAPMGAAADRFGRKPVLIINNIVMSVSVILFAVIQDPVILLIVAAIKGICEAGCSTSTVALLAEKSGSISRTSAFALLGFSGTFAFAIGSFSIPLVVIFEWFGFGTRAAHISLYIMLSLLSLISILFILRIHESRETYKKERYALLSAPSRKILLGYAVSGFILNLGSGIIIPLMTRWFFLMYSITDVIAGPVLGTAGFLAGLGILAVPAITHKYGIVRSILLVQSLAMIAFFFIPLSPNFLTATGFYTIRTLFINMAGTLQQSFIAGIVPSEEQGIAAGIGSVIWRTPNTVSTVVGAGLIGGLFMDLPFYLGAALYGISIVVFWIYFRNIHLPEERMKKEDINIS